MSSRISSNPCKYGEPVHHSRLEFPRYRVGYNPRLRCPDWVAENLPRITHKIRAVKLRPTPKFRSDHRLPEKHRAEKSDFKGSGYTMGHMAAAGNYRGHPESRRDTFVLSNIIPQFEQVNSGPWNELENWTRKLINQYHEVFVVSGPLFIPRQVRNGHWVVSYRVIGNNVAAPSHFYKVILAERKENDPCFMAGFIVPNRVYKRKIPFQKFQEKVESIEKVSGLIFFDKLDLEISKLLKSKLSELPI